MADGWFIIANPVSGGGRAKRVGEQVAAALRECGAVADMALTSGPGDGEELARSAVARGVRYVAVCGGDGTVHEAVNGLAGTDGVLGIVPCGRGNDLARALGLSGTVAKAVHTLVRGRDRRIDLGRVGDRYFGTVASVGFDAEVARVTRAGPIWLGGTATYLRAILKGLIRYRCPHVTMTGDFGAFEGRIFLAATGNSSFYGGGIQIVPGAVVDDGQLDVCLVQAVSRRQVLWLLPRAYRGGHVRHPAVRMLRTRVLTLASSEPLWVFADGEPVGQTPVEIAVAPGALGVRG